MSEEALPTRPSSQDTLSAPSPKKKERERERERPSLPSVMINGACSSKQAHGIQLETKQARRKSSKEEEAGPLFWYQAGTFDSMLHQLGVDFFS